ncbi:hypothetical protein [uncultured Christiangramia sp.]|uniref:hypothetical protein n=1 Tax=uncultured Christiangramia sp. TaxID=503836 RepID=UPI002631FFAE|nr:hypothetical protein [uncultured Christiangramia sp.]
MRGLTLEIKFTDGRWLVNGKRLANLSEQEREFMNNFFKELKLQEARENQEVLNFIKRQAAEQRASISYYQHQKELQS